MAFWRSKTTQFRPPTSPIFWISKVWGNEAMVVLQWIVSPYLPYLTLKRPATHLQKKATQIHNLKSQHQIASERRHHPYNVIPLPSTLATTPENRVNGRDLNKNSPSCSVPFKEMLGSSSCRCLLLVGPPDFVVMLSLSLSVEKFSLQENRS